MAVIPNDEAKTRLQNAIEEYIRNHDRTKEEEKIKAKVGWNWYPMLSFGKVIMYE